MVSWILLPDIWGNREMKENVTGASLSPTLPIAKPTEICILIGIMITDFTEYTLSSTES